jgi:hypothetical protein
VTVRIAIAVVVAAVLAGCGSATTQTGAVSAGSGTTTGIIPFKARPQSVDPNAGVGGPGTATAPVGDVNAHAQSLAIVKRELKQLNICGGASSASEAAPIVSARAPGFYADPGTIQNVGQLPILTAHLNALAQALHVRIYGISGYRTPAHSVAVGGYATDPHTLGEAEDIGVNSLLRSSAAQISEAELARYGLYRPFDPSDDPNNTEVNHIQLIPAGGTLSLAQAEAELNPDPLC